MPTIALLCFMAVWSPKPDLTLRFKDISITRALSSAKLVGIKLELPIKIEGRIGQLLIEVRGQWVFMRADAISIVGDPVRWVAAVYHRKTEAWWVKAEALGGIIEVNGVIPKGE